MTALSSAMCSSILTLLGLGLLVLFVVSMVAKLFSYSIFAPTDMIAGLLAKGAAGIFTEKDA
jgi:hypothetical protein